MSCYPEPDSHIRDKDKVILDLTKHAIRKNYATKNGAMGVDTSSLATKIDFIALKAEVEKLDIKKWLMFQLI